jgi:hypothetical protein
VELQIVTYTNMDIQGNQKEEVTIQDSHTLGPLDTRARDHEIGRAQKEVSKDCPTSKIMSQCGHGPSSVM